MSKLKVGDITIENGSISFSQHQTTNSSLPQSSPTPQPEPSKESSLKETMANVPGTPILWTGAAIVSPLIGSGILLFADSLFLIFAVPLLFFGFFCLGIAFVKKSQAQRLEQKEEEHKHNVSLENKSNLLSVLENKSEKWTFEKLSDETTLSQEDLLLALKACVDDKQVEEELDTTTGDWYYVWQEPQKEIVRPKSLDERLQEMKKN